MKRFILLAAVVALVGTLGTFAATASAAQAAPAAPAVGSVSVPITAAQSNGVLDGVLTVTRFAVNSAGQLVAVGTFSGTYTNAAGVSQPITSAVTAAVDPAAAACPIIDLVLGPLHLDLLGLVVDLNQVHLQVTAVPGAGNLLGNLLCGVVHLLDGTGATGGLAAVLNRVLSLL
jgi:hypothetical protein